MSMSVNANTRPPAGAPASPASRRLLIFQEARNPQNVAETVYIPVNKLGLPICGDGPELPSILELPLRVLRVFTDTFNQPKYKGWAVVSAGPYRDITEDGKFYAVLLEQTQHTVHASHETHMGTP
ncbi:hypothetical protein N7519_000582 [Penicillium mononematosum]|uniref:uncharacterized protein n=1 Tax=Penicillium mononematosum TaxID=268346 RepID=UPI00254999FB|nr:uncharacterized protein N7519_000582 [Penicillium mononematosum]KAJ6190561.1 hypothetical protein N7519_000582 [Penicillium mononematosum]